MLVLLLLSAYSFLIALQAFCRKRGVSGFCLSFSPVVSACVCVFVIYVDKFVIHSYTNITNSVRVKISIICLRIPCCASCECWLGWPSFLVGVRYRVAAHRHVVERHSDLHCFCCLSLSSPSSSSPPMSMVYFHGTKIYIWRKHIRHGVRPIYRIILHSMLYLSPIFLYSPFFRHFSSLLVFLFMFRLNFCRLLRFCTILSFSRSYSESVA